MHSRIFYALRAPPVIGCVHIQFTNRRENRVQKLCPHFLHLRFSRSGGTFEQTNDFQCLKQACGHTWYLKIMSNPHTKHTCKMFHNWPKTDNQRIIVSASSPGGVGHDSEQPYLARGEFKTLPPLFLDKCSSSEHNSRVHKCTRAGASEHPGVVPTAGTFVEK